MTVLQRDTNHHNEYKQIKLFSMWTKIITKANFTWTRIIMFKIKERAKDIR